MEGWEIYPTQVGDELTLIAVDLTWGGKPRTEELSWLFWLRVPFESEPGALLPFEAEKTRLEEVEGWLSDEIERESGAVVARLTMPGRREFFAYTSTDCSAAILQGLQARFSHAEFEARGRHDPNWQVYDEFLFPDPVQSQRILNQQMIRNLEAGGDVVKMPRRVEHNAFFHSEDLAEEYCAFLVTAGFKAEISEIPDEALDRPFGVRALKTHAVDLGTLDPLVLQLFIAARERGGEYDGWSCEVMKLD